MKTTLLIMLLVSVAASEWELRLTCSVICKRR